MKKSNMTEETRHYSAMGRLILSAISYYFFTYSIETSTTSSMSRIVEDHRHMIDTFLQERRADLLFVVRSYTFKDLSDPQKLEQVFARLQEKSNTFVDLGIFNEMGVHVAYHGPYRLEGKIYKHTKWFKEVMKRGYYISDIFLGFRRVPHFIIAIAKEEQGRRWVIRATIDTYLFSNLVEGVRIGKTGEAYLLNAQGVFQTERRSGGHLLDTPLHGLGRKIGSWWSGRKDRMPSRPLAPPHTWSSS